MKHFLVHCEFAIPSSEVEILWFISPRSVVTSSIIPFITESSRRRIGSEGKGRVAQSPQVHDGETIMIASLCASEEKVATFWRMRAVSDQ